MEDELMVIQAVEQYHVSNSETHGPPQLQTSKHSRVKNADREGSVTCFCSDGQMTRLSSNHSGLKRVVRVERQPY
jgi:hypothetical protein